MAEMFLGKVNLCKNLDNFIYQPLDPLNRIIVLCYGFECGTQYQTRIKTQEPFEYH